MKFKVTSFIICIFVFVLIMGNPFYSQEKQTPAYKSWYDFRNEEFINKIEQEKSSTKEEESTQKKEANYQTWKLPIYMQENLQWMLDDFNKRFEEKVESYKKELKTRFAEFKDMPDDAVLYLEGGIFIERSDYLRLQRYIKDIENLANRPKEVKKDGK